jgi:ribose transport system substrate-binding protein
VEEMTVLRMLRYVLIAAALAIPLALAACGSDDEGGGAASDGGETKKVTIGWTPPDITGVFKTATNYFEKAAADAKPAGFDVEVISRSPATHTDFASQQAIIEDFISRNVDVIAISPADTEAVKPAIRQANDAGIPVIMVNLLEKQQDIDIASYIGFDNAQAAAVSAYAVLDYFGGPGVLGAGEKVAVKPEDYLDLKWWEKTYANADKASIEAGGVIIEGIAGTFFSQARLDGFHSVIDQYPNVKLLGKPLAADWNREKGVKAAENFLSRYNPDEMQFVWAASNEMGLGAINAAERKGVLSDQGGTKAPVDGKVAVFTNDVTPESTDAIRSGKLMAETHHGFPEWGWFGTQFAVQIACGQDVPPTYDIRPRTVYADNADQFYPTPNLPKIDWAKIKQDCKG